MNITDIIEKRRSVRTFDPERPVGDEALEALRESIKNATDPFDGKYTIELKKFDLKGPLSPSTYGTISGASWYLLLGIHDDDASALGAGYAMEQVVLKAAGLDLGTCWMALTFKGADFTKNSDMPADTPLKIISPVGYAAQKRRLMESLTRASLRSSSRKPMADLFWEKDFGTPVEPGNQFYKALEMMRLAPSAKNSQPWRALVDGDTVWFYYENKTGASILDLGIGLCHFDLTLRSEGKNGVWAKSTDAPGKTGLAPAVRFTLA